MDDRIIKARSVLRNADADLIGASNGLSINDFGYGLGCIFLHSVGHYKIIEFLLD